MTNVQAQIAEFNQSALRAAIGFAQLSVENAEHLVNLNLDSAKSALEESVAQAKAVATAKDAQQLTALRAQATEASFEKALAYSRSLYELTHQAQAKVVQFAQEQFNAFNRNLIAAMETAERYAPVNAEMAAAAAKSSVVASEAAVDAFKRAAHEASRATTNSGENAKRAAEAAAKGQRKS